MSEIIPSKQIDCEKAFWFWISEFIQNKRIDSK